MKHPILRSNCTKEVRNISRNSVENMPDSVIPDSSASDSPMQVDTDAQIAALATLVATLTTAVAINTQQIHDANAQLTTLTTAVQTLATAVSQLMGLQGILPTAAVVIVPASAGQLIATPN